jgi:hypothetical protein
VQSDGRIGVRFAETPILSSVEPARQLGLELIT